MTKLGIINAAGSALALALQNLRSEMPEVVPWSLLDDRLLADLAEGAGARERLKDMASTLESGGADAIWLTCSSFPSTVEEIRRSAGVPVTGPDELMFDAIAAGNVSHLTILYSADPARPAVEYHLDRTGLARSARIDWVRWVSDSDDGLGQDVAAEALRASVADGSQRIVLAQYSLERLASPLEQQYGLPVEWGLPYAMDFLRHAPQERREKK